METSTDSDGERATAKEAEKEARRNKEGELKRKQEDNKALDRQLAEENAKKKLKWLSWQPLAIHTL